MILNYTTSVPAQVTIGQISKMLVAAGARQILTEYDKGLAVGIAFLVETAIGPRHFVLPVNSDRVRAVLKSDKLPPRYLTPEHADRVAWRILKDWLEAQLAIIRAGLVELDEVMLPYMRSDDGRTVYEMYRDQQLALPVAQS